MLKIEWRKFFSKTFTKILLVGLFFVTVIIAFMEINSVRYTDKDGVKSAGITKITAGHRLAKDRNKWKGELTPEKIAKIVESYHEIRQQYSGEIPDKERAKTIQSYEEILWFAAEMYTTDDTALYDYDWLAEKDIAHIYDSYEDNLQNMVKAYGKTPEKETFLKEQYKKIKTPIYYEDDGSWQNRCESLIMYFLVLVIVIGFLAAGIFAEEFRNHAEMVFFTTKYGRSKAVKNKILVGMLMTTAVYWVGISIFSLISFGVLGISGFNVPYQHENPYSFYIMTQGQHYLLVLVCGYIACLLSASVTMLITSKMHTIKVAVCLPFLMYYLLIFVSKPFSGVSSVFCFTMDILVNANRALRHPYIIQVGNHVYHQIPFLAVLYLLISIIILPFIYRNYSQYDSAKTTGRGLRKKYKV